MKLSPSREQSAVPYDPLFLGALRIWSGRILAIVCEPINLPAFPGSALRGALGRRLHTCWCLAKPECSEKCRYPDACKFAALFGAGEGDDARRPMVIHPPVPEELIRIAYGGEIEPPFEAEYRGRNRIPRLYVPSTLHVPAGAHLDFGITLFGDAVLLARELVRSLSGGRLAWSSGTVEIVDAQDIGHQHTVRQNRLLDESLSVNAVEQESLSIVAETPLAIRTNEPVDPRSAGFMHKVFTQCLVRARLACAESCGVLEPLPYMPLPEIQYRIESARLYEVTVSRYSKVRRQAVPMTGFIGSWKLRGDFGRIVPLLAAGEALGIGQHTTAGFGRIRFHF